MKILSMKALQASEYVYIYSMQVDTGFLLLLIKTIVKSIFFQHVTFLRQEIEIPEYNIVLQKLVLLDMI